MVKYIIKLSIFVVILVAAACVVFYFNPSLNPFAGLFGKELTIDKTANVVTEVKKISKFTTACYYEEVTLVEKKANEVTDNVAGNYLASLMGKKSLVEDEICIIANGKVRAGYNFDKLADDAIKVTGDTLEVALPPVEIFDIVVNPSNFDIYVNDGNWSHDQVTKIQEKAKAKIEDDAKKAGIMEKAKDSGEEQLVNLFKTFGFGTVILK